MKSELARAINETAHMLAARAFNTIRLRLREQARALAKQGKRPDEIRRAIEDVDMRGDVPDPSTQP